MIPQPVEVKALENFRIWLRYDGHFAGSGTPCGDRAWTTTFRLTEIDPGLPLLGVETLSDHVEHTLGQERSVAVLASIFGFLALVLTCVGLYGLMAYLVQRRTSEIGIRIALGARRGVVIAMVIREALAQSAAGVLVGMAMTFAATRLIASQLYGVSPADPRNAAAAALILITCLGVAGYLPARRASRIDPIRALRQE